MRVISRETYNKIQEGHEYIEKWFPLTLNSIKLYGIDGEERALPIIQKHMKEDLPHLKLTCINNQLIISLNEDYFQRNT